MEVRVNVHEDRTDVFIGGWPLRETVSTIFVALELARKLKQKELRVVTFPGIGKGNPSIRTIAVQ